MTPYELGLYIQDYADKQKEQQEEKIVLTYLGAYWQRVKKMPSLKEILGKNKPKKPQTDEEMLAKVKHLNAIFGGEIIHDQKEVHS